MINRRLKCLLLSAFDRKTLSGMAAISWLISDDVQSEEERAMDAGISSNEHVLYWGINIKIAIFIWCDLINLSFLFSPLLYSLKHFDAQNDEQRANRHKWRTGNHVAFVTTSSVRHVLVFWQPVIDSFEQVGELTSNRIVLGLASLYSECIRRILQTTSAPNKSISSSFML